jgi:hypothetical protein
VTLGEQLLTTANEPLMSADGTKKTSQGDWLLGPLLGENLTSDA